MNWYTYRGSNSASFTFPSLLNGFFYDGKKSLPKELILPFNPLYTGGLFHCYMLDESICNIRGVRVYFVTFILLLMENPDSKQCRPRSDATLCGI